MIKIIDNKKNLIDKILNINFLLIISFFIFLFFYFLNFDYYNELLSNDFQYRYKPNGIIIINQILNLNFNEINFLNSYFISELITGLLLKIFSSELSFSVASNLINIILLFFSFFFFIKNLNLNKNFNMVIIFLLIFFSYIGNWIYCFWKLADVYFLFNFSLVFYFTYQTLQKKKIHYFLYSLFFSMLALLIKPQGVLCIPFVLMSSLIFYSLNSKNFLKIILIFFLIYFLIYPLFIFIFQSTNSSIFLESHVIKFMTKGYITGTIFYTFDEFLTQYSLIKNDFSEILYFYFLFFKKVIYQITFIRETYSTNHNIFLIIYCLALYIFIIFNFKYILPNEKIFVLLTMIINLLSILLHSSLNTADEPNRHQLFNLVPLYLLVSISISRSVNIIRSILRS